MLLTLAAVVFFASIMVFFAQEFIRAFKKVFAIKGAKLIIPLALGSWIVYTYEYWLLWVINYYREFLKTSFGFLVHLIPFQRCASSVALILLLTSISIVPVFVLNWISLKRTFAAYQYSYLVSTLIWITTSVILLALNVREGISG